MGGFTSVDDAADPDRLVRFLDRAATAETGIKHYVAGTRARRQRAGPILDVGSGAGHDVALLHSFGLTGIGVEPSATMLEVAPRRTRELGTVLGQGQGKRFESCRYPLGCPLCVTTSISPLSAYVSDGIDAAVLLHQTVRCSRPCMQ